MKGEMISRKRLVFNSRGDLISAQKEASRDGIYFEIIEGGNELIAEIPADKVLFFRGLGSINFGVSVREH